MNLGRPLDVTGSDDEEKIDKIPPQRAEDFTQSLLFAGVCAAAENYGSVFQAKFAENRPRQLGVDTHVFGIKLDAADVSCVRQGTSAGGTGLSVLLLRRDRMEASIRPRAHQYVDTRAQGLVSGIQA